MRGAEVGKEAYLVLVGLDWLGTVKGNNDERARFHFFKVTLSFSCLYSSP